MKLLAENKREKYWIERKESIALIITPKYNHLIIKYKTMPKYVIEREIPGVGKSTAEQLKEIAKASNEVLSKMGPQIQWVNSYVTDNKIYCIYNAPNEEMVLEHAKQGGFPANSISKVSALIDPITAE